MITFNLAIGLLILIIVNIFLGGLNAMFSRKFNWKKFRTGVYKGAIIFVSVALVYLAGYLNQDIIAFEIYGQKVNLMTAIYLIVLSSFAYYGGNVTKKFISLFTAKNAPVIKSLEDMQ